MRIAIIKTGAHINWILGYGFRFQSFASGSLFYQRIKTRAAVFSSTNPDEISSFLRNTYRQLTANVEMSFAVGWGSYFSERFWHFDLLAAYQFQYFWNQNAMRRSADANLGIYGKPGDLFYHGLTLTARFDF